MKRAERLEMCGIIKYIVTVLYEVLLICFVTKRFLFRVKPGA